MAMPEMEMVKDAALKYDKPTLGRMAQMGQISPTVAVMAGMMRDRIVQSEMKPPAPPTVAEEVMQPMGQRAGLGAIAPGADQGMDQGMGQGMGQPPQPPMQSPAPQGLDQIPVPDQMFQPQGMAGGGIVAFQAGGGPSFSSALAGEMPVDPRYLRAMQAARGTRMPRKELIDLMTLSELQEYNRSGTIPERLASQVQGRMIEGTPPFGGDIYDSQPPAAQQIGIPGVDDSAEMARFARQAQGTGVPMTPPPPPPPPPPSGERPAAAPAAPTSAVPGLREQLLGRIGEAYPDLAGGVKPTEPSVKGIFQERAEAERIAGVDTDFFKNEARNIVKQRDELKGDKKEAANMRLIEAGLRIMGGESPYAFVNIGKGASEALKGFASDVKDIQKTKREYDKSERELRTAEQIYARNKSDEALKEVQRRRERAEERNTSFQKAMMEMELKLKSLSVQEEGVRAQRETAARPSELERMIRLATDPNAPKQQRELAQKVLDQRGGASQQATLQLRALNDLLASKQDQLFATKDKQAKQKIQEEINSIQGQIRSISGLGGAGSVDPELLRRADAILGIR
jgi:hypothetical protein